MAGTFTGTAIDCYTTGSDLSYTSGIVQNSYFNGNVENRGAKVKSNTGFASTDTTAAVNGAATGWTNTFAKAATCWVDGTAVTITVKNNAGTATWTNATVFTGSLPVPLQSGGAVVTSGTGVTTRGVPF